MKKIIEDNLIVILLAGLLAGFTLVLFLFHPNLTSCTAYPLDSPKACF